MKFIYASEEGEQGCLIGREVGEGRMSEGKQGVWAAVKHGQGNRMCETGSGTT